MIDCFIFEVACPVCEKKFKHKNTCTVHIKVKVKNSSSSIAYQDSVGSELFYHIRMHDSDPDPAVDFYKILLERMPIVRITTKILRTFL